MEDHVLLHLSWMDRETSDFDPVTDPERLDSLHRTGLLAGNDREDFDRVTELAARILKVPVCLVSLVESDCQIFVGACGLPAPYDQTRQTPLSHSFCQYAVRTRKPLVIQDARSDQRVTGNGAITDLGVVAYLGFPLVGSDYQVYGAFCVIDSEPRVWTPTEIRWVRDFTAIVADIIDHRSEQNRFRTDLDLIIHDLKNPLSGVMMTAGILEARIDDLPEDLRPLVEALAESANRGSQLLNDISKVDRHQSAACDDFLERIEGVVARHREQAEEKKVNLAYEPASLRPVVSAAGWAVAQIVENLLSNALKFSPQGSTVRVTVSEDERGGVVEISDEGPGFTETDRSRLFQRYARLSAEPTAGEESTGLGLSIVKKLIDQEGGSIELISEPGQGACFRLSFPGA